MRIGSKDSFDRSLFAMQEEGNAVEKLRQEFLSGNRILTAEDDPVGAGRVLQIDQAMTQNDIFQSNQDNADTLLTSVDGQLRSATSILSHMNETFIQLGSDTLSDDNINTLVNSLDSQLKDLFGIANSRDAHDHVLFGGFQLNSDPFTKENGRYVYHGDDGQRYLSISSSIRIPVNYPGSEVFGHILSGNGTIQTNPASTNTGSGVILPSEQVNTEQWQAHGDPQGYTVVFHREGSGEGETYTYDVIGKSTGRSLFTGQPSPSEGKLPRTWKEGETINLNNGTGTDNIGISLTIKGKPNHGDQFTIESSHSDNAFNMIEKELNDIRNAPHTPEGRQSIRQTVANALNDIKHIREHVTQINANVGLSQQTITQLKDDSQKQSLQLKAQRRKIKNFDYVAGTSELMQRSMIFDSMQKMFVKFSQSNLFQYL